jgi:hypothetical protein
MKLLDQKKVILLEIGLPKSNQQCKDHEKLVYFSCDKIKFSSINLYSASSHICAIHC